MRHPAEIGAENQLQAVVQTCDEDVVVSSEPRSGALAARGKSVEIVVRPNTVTWYRAHVDGISLFRGAAADEGHVRSGRRYAGSASPTNASLTAVQRLRHMEAGQLAGEVRRGSASDDVGRIVNACRGRRRGPGRCRVPPKRVAYTTALPLRIQLQDVAVAVVERPSQRCRRRHRSQHTARRPPAAPERVERDAVRASAIARARRGACCRRARCRLCSASPRSRSCLP